MYYIIAFILGFAVAWIVRGYLIKDKPTVAPVAPNVRRERAMEYLKEHGEITNDIYEQMTGVSDAQAERDLDALEKEGVIVQIGKTGHAVKYRLK